MGTRKQAGRPIEAAMAQPGRREAGNAGRSDRRVHGALILGRRSAREGQRHRPQAQVEDPVAKPGLVVVVAFGLRGGDNLDLPAVETEALVDAPDLWLGSLRVGQEDAARATLHDGGRDAGVLDVGERLRGEDHRHVLLAQRLEPLADARGEDRVVEEQPGLIEDQQVGAPSKRSSKRAKR
jgi:hypothetical protein